MLDVLPGKEIMCSHSAMAQPCRRRPCQGTYLAIRHIKDERYALSINLHPKDVALLGIEARTMWALYSATKRYPGEGDVHGQEGEQVLVFARNISPWKSPLVTIVKTGWGCWRKILDKRTLEERIFKGSLQARLAPPTEIDIAKDGSSVLMIRIDGSSKGVGIAESDCCDDSVAKPGQESVADQVGSESCVVSEAEQAIDALHGQPSIYGT